MIDYDREAAKVGAMLSGAERLIARARIKIRDTVESIDANTDLQAWNDWAELQSVILCADPHVRKIADTFRDIMNREPPVSYKRAAKVVANTEQCISFLNEVV